MPHACACAGTNLCHLTVMFEWEDDTEAMHYQMVIIHPYPSIWHLIVVLLFINGS